VLSQLNEQMVRNVELVARVVIQGNQIEKLTVEHNMHLQLIQDLAQSPYPKTYVP
jgi:hypothetical protein